MGFANEISLVDFSGPQPTLEVFSLYLRNLQIKPHLQYLFFDRVEHFLDSFRLAMI